jgi:predicted DNA-binding transcriptional regulator AlpA
MPHEDYEDTSELARRTKTSESYWNKLRVAGDGPPYVKVGRMVRYRPSAVDTWLVNLTRNSTSDPGPAERQDADYR